MRKSGGINGVFVLGALLAVACTQEVRLTETAATSPILESRERLMAALDECTRKHGYDPSAAGKIGESELAPGELAWRQCSYDALRAHEQANPAMKERYEALIAADRRMTEQIQQGTLTRSERRLRIEQMMEELRTAEEVQIEAEEDKTARQEQLRTMTNVFQRMVR